MKNQLNNFNGAAALPITLLVALLFASAIWLASAAVASPTLSNYPDATRPLSTDMTVTPDAASTDTPASQITPAGTTCSQFLSGTQALGTLQYDLKDESIHQVAPRNSYTG